MAAKKAAKKKATTKKTTSTKKTTKMAAPKPQIPVKLPKVTSAPQPKNSTSKGYTFSEFVEAVRGFCGLRKRSEAKELVTDIGNFVTDALRKGYKIPLLGLGKMYVRQTKARTGRNPATGETIQIAPRKRVRFSAAKALKQAVL